jgi:ketosteroid isomerase-like protein
VSTSAENVAHVVRAFTLFAEGGSDALIAAVDELLTEDCVFETAMAGLIEGESVYRGREGFIQYQRDVRETFADFVYEDFHAEPAGDDTVLLTGRFKIEGRGSGAVVAHEVGWLFRLEDGKVAHARSFMDPEQARETAHA